MSKSRIAQLQLLFTEAEFVWQGSLHSYDSKAPNFFVINPLKSLEAPRNDENVASYRNFLFEFDSISLDEQFSALEKLKQSNFKVATAVFSGSKSIHLIVSLADSLTVPYKQAWLALSTELTSITNLIADPSCKNPSRLSRLAGAHRLDTGKVQELLYLGSLISNSYILTLISKYELGSVGISGSAPPKPLQSSMSMDQFRLAIKKHRGLQLKLIDCEKWIKSANNYPEILKLTMWAIDSTGVPCEVFKEYCYINVLPKLLNVNYSKERLDIAIENAYNYKF